MNGSRIIVTGASGFLGCHLLQSFVRDKVSEPVVAVTRDASRVPDLELESFEVTVGNLAQKDFASQLISQAGDILLNLLYVPAEDFTSHESDNMQIVEHLIGVMSKCPPKLIIHISTAMIIGDTRDLNIHEDTPCVPVTSYQQVKLAIESKFRTFSQEHDVPLVILRPAEIFGPHGQGLNNHLENIKRSSWAYNSLKSLLLGNRRLHYIHVDKVVDVIRQVMRNPPKNTPAEILVTDDCPENNFLFVNRLIGQEIKGYSYRLPSFALPQKLLSMIYRLLGKDMNCAYIFSSSRRETLNYTYKQSFSADVVSYINWVKEHHGRDNP